MPDRQQPLAREVDTASSGGRLTNATSHQALLSATDRHAVVLPNPRRQCPPAPVPRGRPPGGAGPAGPAWTRRPRIPSIAHQHL